MKQNKMMLGISISLLISILIYAYMFGEIFNPTYTEWLFNLDRDLIQHYLGWIFYKNSQIQFPIFSLIQNYGLPKPMPITFTDSIPIMAFIFKIFGNILPNKFQYFGLWTLICFVLQGIFSFLIIEKLTKDKLYSCLCIIFFLLSSPMLFRVNFHFALVAHWLILALYYNIIRESSFKKKMIWNNILILSTLLIHPYFFFIITPIIYIYILNEYIQKYITQKQLIINYLIPFVLTIIMMYFLGFFYIGLKSGETSEYGIFSANLNSFINPFEYSYFLKERPWSLQQIEGLTYLGLGIIISFPLAVISSYKKINLKNKKNYLFFILGFIYIILACGNTIAFDNKSIYFDLPEFLKNKLGIIRASGRFLWPIFYVVIIYILVYIHRFFKSKKRYIYIVLAILLQIVDLNPQIKKLDKRYENQKWKSTLKSEIWSEISSNYKAFFYLGEVDIDDYVMIAEFASKNKMILNDGYFARKSTEITEEKNREIQKILNKNPNKESIYIVNDTNLIEKINKIKTEKDFFDYVDNELLYIPNAKDKLSENSLKNLNKNLLKILEVYPSNYDGQWKSYWNKKPVISINGENFSKKTKIYINDIKISTTYGNQNNITGIFDQELLNSSKIVVKLVEEKFEKNKYNIISNTFEIKQEGNRVNEKNNNTDTSL